MREEGLAYQQSILSIRRFEGVNEVLEENLALYHSLLGITEKAFKAGYKTGYDVQTLQNSIKSAELEIAINDMNIQIELAKLHFAMKHD